MNSQRAVTGGLVAVLAALLFLSACGETTVLSLAPTSGQPALTGAASPAKSSGPDSPTPPAKETAFTVTINATNSSRATATLPVEQGSPAPVPITTPVPLQSSPIARPTPTVTIPLNEQEISFTSGKNMLYGSLLLPVNPNGKLPAALLLAGSGPTDRNGNSRLLQGEINSQRDFARSLAAQGVASLRYDKVGSGRTGLASFAQIPADIGFQTFVDEANQAYDFLKNRPEIDPQRLMIFGHSEGGLIALILAGQLKTGGPKALVLAAPLSRPYLETIRLQLATQYAEAQQTGLVTKEQADTALTELGGLIKSLMETGKLPASITTTVLKQLFNPANEKFLSQVSQYDPARLASGLPSDLPALVMCGQKDQQVSCADVQNLMSGFQKAGNRRAVSRELVNVNHVFKEVPGAPRGALDYTNPDLSFSIEAATLLAAFIKTSL